MKKRTLVIVSLLGLLVSAGAAQAERIAGWDFSQYATAGRLTIDGTTFVNTLDANYSGLRPGLFGFGASAGQFGKMVMDGTLGSSAVSASTSATVIPTPRAVVLGNAPPYSGAIRGNASGFDVFGALTATGQANTEFLALLANAANTVVFSADLSPLGQTGLNWSVQFGGETLAGSSNVFVGLDVGCDGGLDVGPTPVAVDTTTGATTQAVTFPGLNISTQACVQFGLDSGAVIDNVSIEATPVPEAGSILMLTAGIGGLAVLRRIRS